MRFLADMGISQGVVLWLRDGGHDAVHLREEGLHLLPNGKIFDKAQREKRIILTVDLDFGEIVALSGGHPFSTVIFRLYNTRPGHVIERLRSVLKESGQVLQQGAIVVIEESRHRIRRLPFNA